MHPEANKHARLAQSVERQALNLVVGGSSPPVGDSFFHSLFNHKSSSKDDHIKEAAPAEHEKEAAAPAAEQDEVEKEPEPAAEAEAQEEQPEENDTLDEIQRAGEKFEETINDYKKKKGRFRFFD